MGRVVALYQKAQAEFDKAKPVVAMIPSNYQENFNNKYADLQKFHAKAKNENDTIYFEKVIPLEQLPPIEFQNFVKMDSSLDDINGKQAIEEKLRHIVPPNVRAMQVELKNKLQEVINQQFEREQQYDAQMKQFLT